MDFSFGGSFGGGDGGFGGSSGGGGFDGGGGGAGGPSPAKGTSMYDEVTLSPITIRQFHKAEILESGGKITLDGQELRDFKIVGRIVEVNSSKDASFDAVVEDGTGRLKVSHWYPTNADGSIQAGMKHMYTESFQPGVYVTVHAMAKVANSRKTVNGASLQLLRDPNLITLHLLDAIAVHLQRTRGLPGSSVRGSASAASSVGGVGYSGASAAAAAVSMFHAPVGLGMPAALMHSAPSGSSAMPLSSTSSGSAGPLDIKAAVRAEIGRVQSGEGASVKQVALALARMGVSEDQVRAAVEELSMDGHVYSTVDDDHYLATDES